ncbi:MAG: GIY-YIG nuclease family protein [Syntrophaceae bacterium]|nr:GIY-YIG nuclease family protein [Syntrophaceae bacterium]
MAQSPLRLIKGRIEFISKSEINRLSKNIRGIYALFDGDPENKIYNVKYVGMSTKSIRGRIKRHRKKKQTLWSYCSIFEVWENVRDEEIKELEGILRHIYRFDQTANQLNEMKSFKAFKKTVKIELSPTRQYSRSLRSG